MTRWFAAAAGWIGAATPALATYDRAIEARLAQKHGGGAPPMETPAASDSVGAATPTAPVAPPTNAVSTAPPAPTCSAPPPVTRAGNDDSVPITMIHNSNHVVVTVGGRPLDMVLDAGANVSSIPPSLANNLIAAGHAEEGPSVPITLANGATEKERTVFVDSLVIGRYARAKVLVSVSDGDPFSDAGSG